MNMRTPPTHWAGGVLFGCGGGIRTHDLQVMSLKGTQAGVWLILSGQAQSRHWGHRCPLDRRPSRHLASLPPRYTPWSPSTRRAHTAATPAGHERLCCDVADTGPDTAIFIETILERKPHPEHGFRSCVGILRVLKALRRGTPRSRLYPRPGERRAVLHSRLQPSGTTSIPLARLSTPRVHRRACHRPLQHRRSQPLPLRSADVGATLFAELGSDLQGPRRRASGRQVDDELEHFHQRITCVDQLLGSYRLMPASEAHEGLLMPE